MIRRVLDGEMPLLPEHGVEALKIRSLWTAYSAKYDFCRFFCSDNTVICVQDGEAVLWCNENCGDNDFDELAEFFSFCGVREIFCFEDAGERLGALLGCKAQLVNLMRFTGKAESAETEVNPPLREVFEIICSAFGLPSDLFEAWYPDMSHRIRHGVSEAQRLGNSVLVVQYAMNGEVLLSQIATLPSEQGKGGASRLISAVCADYTESKINLICADELVGFYKRMGFVFESKKWNLFP